MKTLRPLYILSFFAFCLLMNNMQLNAQALYYGPDKIVNEGDSVVLRLHDYVGNIQWQKSYNKKIWSNVSGATDDTLLFIADKTTYFRAKVTAGNCDPYYSDEIYVNVVIYHKNIVLVDTNNMKLKSDSTELSNGIYKYEVFDTGMTIPSDVVLLDNIYPDYYGRIVDTSYINEEGEIICKTRQAQLIDIFEKIDLQDSIKILSWDNRYLNKFKSTNIKFKGKIIPLHTPLKSTFFKSTDDIDLSDDDDDDGINIEEEFYLSDDKSLKLTLKGLLKFGVTFHREIISDEDAKPKTKKFSCENLSNKDLKYLNKNGINACADGEKEYKKEVYPLKTFKFYAKGDLNLHLYTGLELNKEYTDSKETSLLPVPISIWFPAGPVPVAVEVDFLVGYKLGINASGSMGFDAEINRGVRMGVQYNRVGDPKFERILEKTDDEETNNIDFDFEHFIASANAKCYGKVDVGLEVLGIIGPYINSGPYLDGELSITTEDYSYDAYLGMGVDLAAGIDVDVIGFNKTLWEKEWNLWRDTIYEKHNELESHPPLVNTKDAPNIGISFADVGGEIDRSGGEITEKGIYYSENSDMSNKSTEPCSNFPVTLSGLDENTKYYYQAYAVNDRGEGTGEIEHFTTYGNPEVNTTNIINTSTNSAEIEGEIIDDGGASIVEHGVCYSESGTPDINDDKTNEGNGSTGTFTTTMTSLSSGQTYYVRAYAENSVGGIGYGSKLSVNTENPVSPPKIDIIPVTDIKNVTAKSGGKNIDAGGGTITEKGLCWNTTGSPTTSDNKNPEGTGEVDFTSTISSLTPGETYYVRAYATNSEGTAYSTTETFTTNEPGTPIVTITNHYAPNTGDLTVEYNVDLNSGTSIIERGFIIDGVKQPSDGTGDGNFSKTISVSQDNIHDIQVYATNADGKTGESSSQSYGWSECYPKHLPYWTGYIKGNIAKHDDALLSGRQFGINLWGWFMVDLSNIPPNINVAGGFLDIKIIDGSDKPGATMEIVKVSCKPDTADISDLHNSIKNSTIIYHTIADANLINLRHLETLNLAAIDVLQEILDKGQNWFAVGVREYYDGTTISNWAKLATPLIIVQYTKKL